MMKHSSSLLLASAVSDELREMDPVSRDEADEADIRESASHVCRSIGEAAPAINCVLVAEATRRAVTFLCNARVHSLTVAHCLLDHGTALHAMGEKHAVEALRMLCAGLDNYIYARVPPDARWNEAQRLVAEICNRETLQTEIDGMGNTVEA